MIRKLSTGPSLVLASALSPQECIDRIKPNISRTNGIFGKTPLVGIASDEKIKIRKRIKYQNSFQMIYHASIEAKHGGSYISGAFKMHPLVTGFMAIWVTGVILIGSLLFISGLIALLTESDNLDSVSAIAFLIAPIVMCAFGYALVRFGRHLTESDIEYIKEFLITHLEASEIKNGANQASVDNSVRASLRATS